MAYIEAHQSVLTHRKTLRLGRLLGMDRFCVVGRLVALWSWALDNAQDGIVTVADSDILADVMGWEREPAELCEALVTSGFLELAGDGSFYILHDWASHGGKILRRLEAQGERTKLTATLRQWVIERDALICGICGQSVAPDDVHIDHIVPVSRGGKSDLDNLRVTHSACNLAKGSALPQERQP